MVDIPVPLCQELLHPIKRIITLVPELFRLFGVSLKIELQCLAMLPHAENHIILHLIIHFRRVEVFNGSKVVFHDAKGKELQIFVSRIFFDHLGNMPVVIPDGHIFISQIVPGDRHQGKSQGRSEKDCSQQHGHDELSIHFFLL